MRLPARGATVAAAMNAPMKNFFMGVFPSGWAGVGAGTVTLVSGR
jgi:hypothetical protein